jgi:hypothetical protein
MKLEQHLTGVHEFWGSLTTEVHGKYDVSHKQTVYIFLSYGYRSMDMGFEY